MIDEVRVLSSVNLSGKAFDQIRIWVAGIPFQCDADDYTIRIMKRLSDEKQIHFIDVRKI